MYVCLPRQAGRQTGRREDRWGYHVSSSYSSAKGRGESFRLSFSNDGFRRPPCTDSCETSRHKSRPLPDGVETWVGSLLFLVTYYVLERDARVLS